MEWVKQTVLVLVLSLGLGACASVKDITPPAPQSPAQAVFLAKSEYGLLVKAAANYNELDRCREDGPPICSSETIVRHLRLAQVAARATLDAAGATVRNPAFGDTATQSAVIAAVNAVSAFKEIKDKLGVY